MSKMAQQSECSEQSENTNIDLIQQIYDSNFVCEYENEVTDTKYREEFLRAFRMKDFIEDELIDKQKILLDNIKHERKFLRLVENAAKHASVTLMDPQRASDCDFGIMMLFSFDFFATFHRCLSSYINNNTQITSDFIESYNALLKLLEN